MASRVQVNTVDVEVFLVSTGRKASHRSMARESGGRLWVIYRDATNAYVYAAYSDDVGASWTEERVSAAASQGAAAQFIMIDSSGVPHAIWGNTTGTDTILYSTRSGGSWSAAETIHTSGGTLNNIAACIDGGDTFHIAWEESTEVKYRSGTTGSWGSAETVDADGYGPVDITVDSSNKPWCVFWIFTGGSGSKVTMRERTGGSWSAAENVSSLFHSNGASTKNFLSIAMDSSDDLHVTWTGDLYGGTGDWQVRYRKRTSGSWGTDTQVKVHPDAPNQNMGCVIIVLDDADDVWIIYQQAEPAQAQGGDEGVYYKKIESGTLGGEALLDPNILRPGNWPSTYAGLWQRFPSSCILPASVQPIVAINDEAVSNATLWFFGEALAARKGYIWIEGVDYHYIDANGVERKTVVTGQASEAFDWNGQNLTGTGTIRAGSSVWDHEHDLFATSLDPGASGATRIVPDSNTLGGWQLNAAGETLYFEAHVEAEWDAVSDLRTNIWFEVNVDNSGGSAGDTVDLKLVIRYKGEGDTVIKTQTVEVATVVGASARYKQFKAAFTIDFDAIDNVIDVLDVLSFALNLETDTSEVDDIVIQLVELRYKTTKPSIETP